MEWSEEDLLKNWLHFSEQLKEKEKINLHNIFQRYSPKKNNNEFNLRVVSLSEKSEIQEIKLELLEFLKERLENDFIKMNIKISEEKKNMLHTKEEKYQHIVKENEKIKLLQEKLNLNII